MNRDSKFKNYADRHVAIMSITVRYAWWLFPPHWAVEREYLVGVHHVLSISNI